MIKLELTGDAEGVKIHCNPRTMETWQDTTIGEGESIRGAAYVRFTSGTVILVKESAEEIVALIHGQEALWG